MTTMTAAEKNTAIKNLAVEMLNPVEMADGIQVGDYVFAVPVSVAGEDRYCEVTFTAKNNKATKVSPAYDPYDKAEEWQAEKEFKAKEKAAKEKAKADKIAKSKKAKAEKEAKAE